MSLRRATQKALHPALVRQSELRAASLQNRVADEKLAHFGGIIRQPAPDEAARGKLPDIEFVQLGNPICADGKPHDACEGPVLQVLERNDTQAPYAPKPIATGADTADKVIPMRDTSMFHSVLEGAGKFLDEVQYWQRLNEIETLVHGPDPANPSGLKKDRSDIGNRLHSVGDPKNKVLAL